MTIKYIFFDWGNTLGTKGARKNNMWRTNRNIEELRKFYLKPGTLEILHYLKGKNYILGIITNSSLNTFENMLFLESLGLLPYFSYVISSSDKGICRKDCPEIFRMALNYFRAKPNEAVYVGDNYKKDIIGSKKVGMKSIYVSNSRHPYFLVSPKNKAIEDGKIKEIIELTKFL